MALSLLSHSPQINFWDLQAIFDSTQLHQQQQRTTEIDIFDCTDSTVPMEYNTHNNLYQRNNNNCIGVNNNHNNNNNNNTTNSNTVSNNNNSNNIMLNNNNSNNNTNNPQFINTGNLIQSSNGTNRNFLSGYHNHHIDANYEQVINFVDSPPNSEESWTDEHSKGSPGPLIIDVQTIYSSSGSRKRRMDWDSLDIGEQSENTTQSSEIPNKILNQDKDKQKKDKANGRGTWADDIGFDLSSEFNSNSYLNNETFLSFSPSLTVLKQEPQTEQLRVNKNILNLQPTVETKPEKSPSIATDTNNFNNNPVPQERAKKDVNENQCLRASPKGSQINSPAANDRADGVNGNAGEQNTFDKNYVRQAGSQQLTVIDANKIENSSNAGASNAEDHKFQYILAAATSIATKNNEDTLTYLNQGQSYEIKLKKIGDLSFYRDKILKSVIKICFHERRLQYMEREQLQQWQSSRPGERIIEVDVPLSYGLCHVSQSLNPNYLNTVEIFWDPLKEVGVYIKVNCISTEFTPKKHGGEKGVPFRLQIETFIDSSNTVNNNLPLSAAAAAASSPSANGGVAATLSPDTPGNRTPTNGLNVPLIGNKQPVHAAACQIKVFKLKGADRKHKQDREKIQKRPQSEQDKFQPSYECTIMNDISLDTISPPTTGCYSPEYMKVWPNSPVHIQKYDGILPYTSGSPAANSSPIAINNVTSTNSPNLKLMDANMVSPPQIQNEIDEYTVNIMPESTTIQVTQWLTAHRLTAYLSTFAQFCGADIMRMSKDDLIQICGLADGIRMFNILRAKAIAPRLTIYVSLDGQSYNAIYLLSNTAKELTQKIIKIPGFYEMIANSGNNTANGSGTLENASNSYNNWNMHSKYSGSGTNIYNDVNKNFIYISGPAGVHVTITDEVLNNEIKDNSLYALEVQNGKVIIKLMNRNDN